MAFPPGLLLDFHPDLTLPGEVSAYRLILGGLLFWFPGIVWTWALTPRLAWAYRAPISIIAAFSIQPGIMMLLNLLLRVPVNLATTSLLSAALGLAGLLVLLRRLEPLWDPERALPTTTPAPAPGPPTAAPPAPKARRPSR